MDRASTKPITRTEISLRCEIGQGAGLQLYRAIRDYPQPITILIDSIGGDFLLGMRCYDMLRRHPTDTTARIVGRAESTAYLIAAGCRRIEIVPEGRIMIHNPRGDEYTRHSVTGLADRLADIYVERTGLAKAAIVKWLREERYFSAAEAVRLRFADAIC